MNDETTRVRIDNECDFRTLRNAVFAERKTAADHEAIAKYYILVDVISKMKFTPESMSEKLKWIDIEAGLRFPRLREAQIPGTAQFFGANLSTKGVVVPSSQLPPRPPKVHICSVPCCSKIYSNAANLRRHRNQKHPLPIPHFAQGERADCEIVVKNHGSRRFYMCRYRMCLKSFRSPKEHATHVAKCKFGLMEKERKLAEEKRKEEETREEPKIGSVESEFNDNDNDNDNDMVNDGFSSRNEQSKVYS